MSMKTHIINFLIKTGHIRKIFTSKVRHWSSELRTEDGHFKHESNRLKQGQRREVHYFHQSDDPYSHLTAQVINQLAQHYDIDIVPHLVGAPDSNIIASFMMESYIQHRRDDAIAIAPFYNLEFPACKQPAQALKQQADRILSQSIIDGTFLAVVSKVSEALWRNDAEALATFPQAPQHECDSHIQASEKQRLDLGYVYGSTFYYGGEWCLGVDRINYLEERLISQGARRPGKQGVVVPRPQQNPTLGNNAEQLTLEFFPSVRSPYTAVVMPRVKELVARTGIKLVMRPVLPIIMRSGKFSGNFKEVRTEQAIYVYMDAAREARMNNHPYGDYIDATGTPILNCYSLFPWARDQGKGFELIEAFTDATFSRGINSATEAGMQTIVERAGLNWSEAKDIMGNNDWQAEFDQNMQDMYDMGLWGVPSFRISGGGLPATGIWGQDRMWLMEADIESRVANAKQQATEAQIA